MKDKELLDLYIDCVNSIEDKLEYSCNNLSGKEVKEVVMNCIDDLVKEIKSTIYERDK